MNNAPASRRFDVAFELAVVSVVACVRDPEIVTALIRLEVHSVVWVQQRMVDGDVVFVVFVVSSPVECRVVLSTANQLWWKSTLQCHILAFSSVLLFLCHHRSS